MGTRYSYNIIIDSKDETTINSIIEYGREIDEEKDPRYYWDKCFFGKWSNFTKWDADYFVKKLSKKFESVIFAVYFRSSEGSGKFFVFNGECIYPDQVWKPRPVFPSLNQIKRAVKNLKKGDSK